MGRAMYRARGCNISGGGGRPISIGLSPGGRRGPDCADCPIADANPVHRAMLITELSRNREAVIPFTLVKRMLSNGRRLKSSLQAWEWLARVLVGGPDGILFSLRRPTRRMPRTAMPTPSAAHRFSQTRSLQNDRTDRNETGYITSSARHH